MKKWAHKVLPLLVLIVGLLIGMTLIMTGPETQRRKPPVSLPTVEVMTIAPEDFRVIVRTRGTVAPRTQSTLVSEVAGRVLDVAPIFRSGEFFEHNEVLLTIDPTNYENAVTIAGAGLSRARLAMAQEEAQAVQAQRDWEKLGLSEKPSGLVLRLPQLENAQADVAAAGARLRQAEADLSRTRIRAPYAGRVLEKLVDVGQYVTPGTMLAKVFAVDYVEIRLPLTDSQLAFVDLPEHYRNEGANKRHKAAPVVKLSASIGQNNHAWQAKLVRTDGAIDTQSRQLFVVAQVDDPYAQRGDTPPLKIGQFVEAEIQGNVLSNVFVLPRNVLDADDRVLIVTPERQLKRRDVEILWRNGGQVVISNGLKNGEQVSLTNMPFAIDGTKVKIFDETEESKRGKAGAPDNVESDVKVKGKK